MPRLQSLNPKEVFSQARKTNGTSKVRSGGRSLNWLRREESKLLRSRISETNWRGIGSESWTTLRR